MATELAAYVKDDSLVKRLIEEVRQQGECACRAVMSLSGCAEAEPVVIEFLVSATEASDQYAAVSYLYAGTRQAVPALRWALEHVVDAPGTPTHAQALRALAHILKNEARPEVERYLRSSDPDLNMAALHAATELDDPALIPHISPFLTHPNASFHDAALGWMARLNSPETRACLRAARPTMPIRASNELRRMVPDLELSDDAAGQHGQGALPLRISP